jgi:hypothetical protein
MFLFQFKAKKDEGPKPTEVVARTYFGIDFKSTSSDPKVFTALSKVRYKQIIDGSLPTLKDPLVRLEKAQDAYDQAKINASRQAKELSEPSWNPLIRGYEPKFKVFWNPQTHIYESESKVPVIITKVNDINAPLVAAENELNDAITSFNQRMAEDVPRGVPSLSEEYGAGSTRYTLDSSKIKSLTSTTDGKILFERLRDCQANYSRVKKSTATSISELDTSPNFNDGVGRYVTRVSVLKPVVSRANAQLEVAEKPLFAAIEDVKAYLKTPPIENPEITSKRFNVTADVEAALERSRNLRSTE